MTCLIFLLFSIKILKKDLKIWQDRLLYDNVTLHLSFEIFIRWNHKFLQKLTFKMKGLVYFICVKE